MAGANYEKGREQDYNYYKHIILHPYIFRWHCIPMGLCKRCRDVFVVRSCSLVPFLFHNLHQPHPYITLNFEEMFFLLVPLIFFVHLGVAVPAHTGKSCPVGGQER